VNENGEPCPYHAHRPQTREGNQAWHLIGLCQGQLRLGGMGVVYGFEMTAVLAMARTLGYDERAMALLVPYGEAGLVRALNRRDEEK